MGFVPLSGRLTDSDLHTFSYEFKPWQNDKAIAGAEAILDYLRETASEYGIDSKIRVHHKVRSAAWSSAEGRWLVEVERTDTGGQLTISCGWFFCAGGYYRYDQGFTPPFEGRERFGGDIVHPQHWPEDLDYRDKRVIVIGSGATAVTLIPALAATAAHVTMLQRHRATSGRYRPATRSPIRCTSWSGPTWPTRSPGRRTSSDSGRCSASASAIREPPASSSDTSPPSNCRTAIR